MSSSYLDNNGLLYLWQKIKAGFAEKSDIPSPSSTSPAMDSSAVVGTSTDYARADHVHPSDSSKAPTSHASTSTTYGKGSSSNYGHVKLSDSTTATTAAASGGTAATPKAVSDALTAAKAYADTKEGTNTTYTLEQDVSNGHILVFTPSVGSATTITIPDDDTVYDPPTYTAHTEGLYKFANNTLGHISSATAATASDIKSLLGNTAVNRATSDSNGNNIASTYAKKEEITGVYKYKGSVANSGALPASGQSIGDVYNIESSSTYGAAGANVAWNGTAWDTLGEVFAIESITNAEIDTIVAS